MLSGAQAGADWAWRQLYSSVAGQLVGYARAKGVADPEDLAGTVVLRLAERIGDFRGDEPAFRSWVFTIAHNAIVDDLRSQKPTSSTASPETHLLALRTTDDPEREVLAQLGLEHAIDALDDVAPEHRDVVLLRVIGGFSVDEVAEILGRRPGTVRVQQHRAFKKLRGRLAQSTEAGVTR